MFLFAVAIFLFHSMYSSFSCSSFSKPIHDRQIAPVAQLIGYNEEESILYILKPSKSSSIYCGSQSEVHEQINKFCNLMIPDEMRGESVLRIENTESEDCSTKLAILQLPEDDNSSSRVIFGNKREQKQDYENKDLLHDKKEAKIKKLLRNRARLTAATIRIIVSKGIYPVITIQTPVDKDFYIESILSLLPAGTPLKFVKSEGCRLSFSDKDFDALARIALSKDEVINDETFMSVFQLICEADQEVASQKEFVDVNLQNDIDQKGLLDDRIEEDNQIDYDPTQGDETGVLDPDQATSPENQNLIPEKYHKKLVEMAQDLKKRGLTVEPILKEFFKVVYTKEYRGKCNQEALDELIMDAQSAATNAADMTKEKLKTKQNDNKFTKTIPQKPNVINNLFSWGMYIGKYIVGLYGLTHIIFALRSKFKR